jgi:hypothetical protein
MTARVHSVTLTGMVHRYEFREELLPLSLLLTRETLQADDVDGIFDHYRGLCQRRISFVAISDVRAARQLPDAATCQRFGEAAALLAAEFPGCSLGAGIVLESALIRGALSAIEWLYHPEVPTMYFGDMHAAVRWAIAKLEAIGAPISSAIRELERVEAGR